MESNRKFNEKIN